MFTIISRIFHFGANNFWRNGWLSTATVAIMTLSAIVFVGLIMFGVTAHAAAGALQNEIDIAVYFKTTTSEDEILSIQQSLQQLSQVSSVDYISQEQAQQTFQEQHSNDQEISQALNDLQTNPFEASLNIKAKDPSQYGAIAQYLSSPDLSQYIDSTSYQQNQAVIDRLATIVRDVNVGGWAVIIFLAIIAGLVVFNTIRLAIYSNREEIGIMRLVGASNSLVRGPYIVEGVMWGALAAVLSLLIAGPAFYLIAPYMNAAGVGVDIFHYFITHIAQILLYQLLFAVVIGVFSSYWAVQRYLRN
jgi:cell division transport system permease protein